MLGNQTRDWGVHCDAILALILLRSSVFRHNVGPVRIRRDPFQQKAGTVAPSKEPGLLFYLSGDHGFNADYAAGGVSAPLTIYLT